MKYAALAGRQLFSIIFILGSVGHFRPSSFAYAAQHGVPAPGLLVPLSGVIALVGGLSVLLGYQTRLGAWLLVLFLVPVTLMMHNFWAMPDARIFEIERAMFLRNVTMLGGALLICYFGGGPLSLDGLIGSLFAQTSYDARVSTGGHASPSSAGMLHEIDKTIEIRRDVLGMHAPVTRQAD
jgi:putative oxidoreductase